MFILNRQYGSARMELRDLCSSTLALTFSFFNTIDWTFHTLDPNAFSRLWSRLSLTILACATTYLNVP